MPTVLDLLDVRHKGSMQGISLVELMRTGKRAEDPPALSEFTKIGPERKAIRKDGFKYIWVENPYLIKKFTFKKVNQFEVFDLSADPSEQHNLYEANQELAKEYHEVLTEELKASRALNEEIRRSYSPTGQKEREIDKDLTDNLRSLGYLD